MQVHMTDSLEITSKSIEQASFDKIVQRAIQCAISNNKFEQKFGTLILRVANADSLGQDRLYIMDMLNDQLDVELMTQEMLNDQFDIKIECEENWKSQ